MPAFMLYFKPAFIEAKMKRINKNKGKNEKDIFISDSRAYRNSIYS